MARLLCHAVSPSSAACGLAQGARLARLCCPQGCGSYVKPGIVFFGESLPERFWAAVPEDFGAADLLIVMGTSLVVHPFASLIGAPGRQADRQAGRLCGPPRGALLPARVPCSSLGLPHCCHAPPPHPHHPPPHLPAPTRPPPHPGRAVARRADRVGEGVPRLLINREVVGEADPALRSVGYTKGLDFGAGNYRDALHLGDCDGGVRELCRLLEWEGELDVLIGAEAGAGAASLPTQAAEAAGPQV